MSKKIYGYDSIGSMELNDETIKFEVDGNKMFSNNLKFIIDYVSSANSPMSFASRYLFFKKTRNDWYEYNPCSEDDDNTKTFFEILEKEKNIAFQPHSWKEVFVSHGMVNFYYATNKDFKKWVKMYKTFCYWFIIIKNEDPILNSLEFWCDEDEFQGIHSLTLLKDGELFDNKKELRSIALKYSSLSEIDDLIFIEDYSIVKKMFKDTWLNAPVFN